MVNPVGEHIGKMVSHVQETWPKEGRENNEV
jgi:hypothetical protein